jgi:hypothetical protein
MSGGISWFQWFPFYLSYFGSVIGGQKTDDRIQRSGTQIGFPSEIPHAHGLKTFFIADLQRSSYVSI